MKKTEQLLSRLLNNFPEVDFDKIKNAPYEPMHAHDDITNPYNIEKKPSLMKKHFGRIITFILAVFIFIGFEIYDNKLTHTVISIDSDTTVNIRLNSKGDIIKVKAYGKNENTINRIDYSNLSTKDMVNQTVNVLILSNEISKENPYVIIGVNSSDKSFAKTAFDIYAKEIEDISDDKDIDCRIISQGGNYSLALDRLAKKYNTSLAKISLAKEIVTINNQYVLEDIIDMPLSQIYDLVSKNYEAIKELRQKDKQECIIEIFDYDEDNDDNEDDD